MITRSLFPCLVLSLFVLSCSTNRATIDNSLKKYFDENKVDGCFTMLNNANGEVTVYNMSLDTMRFSPASTFKIVNSLIGLQTGAVPNEKTIVKWDGIKRREAWDKDMDMKEAFKVSCVPYYQDVARKVGKDSLKRWIDSVHYGNGNINGPVDSFWLNNQLKISPDEQLGMVKRLFFDQLPFNKSYQGTVRDMMLREDSTTHKLSYKTGWGFEENGNAIGWMVGWIQENMHVYFFVTFVRANAKDVDMEAVRMNITKGILRQYGFFQGKM